MAEVIDMPKLSDTMTVGTLVRWLKKEGDPVKSGDMLAEVETDKATMELESFFDGTLLKIFLPAGSQAPIGQPLCAIGNPAEKVDVPPSAPASAAPGAATAGGPAAPASKAKEPAAGPASEKSQPAAAAQGAGTKTAILKEGLPSEASAKEERIRISPLARKLAEEKGIDPSRLTGSGPGGRIVRADVLAAEKAGPAAAKNGAAQSSFLLGGTSQPIQEEGIVPLSNMRAAIARRLVESKSQIPHFYIEIEIDAAPLLDLRAQLNVALEAERVKLSVNDFILRGSARALRRVPAVNCSWEGEGIRRHPVAHVAFAVAIEDGLITPVIRDTEAKTLAAISTEAKSLAQRAKAKKLAPAEFTGGTFCVSNLGMMGIDRFSAIINPPNAAILAVGTTVKKPVVDGDRIVVGQRLSLTLSCDHRVVDGATGAAYLAALKDVLEKPALLLL
jgi:pyruvate dehydrogenase E2 component (dihydrolipoamide acetyltransferase)